MDLCSLCDEGLPEKHRINIRDKHLVFSVNFDIRWNDWLVLLAEIDIIIMDVTDKIEQRVVQWNYGITANMVKGKEEGDRDCNAWLEKMCIVTIWLKS